MTFDQAYEGICGITEQELLTYMKPDIELLTEKMDKTYSRRGMHFTYDDIVKKLKETYDGYHFSKDFTDIYCPWSLLNAFTMGDIMNYWFSTGTPTMLVNVMRQTNISLQQIEHFRATLDRFDAPTERISDPIPVLFQSGYLTLKDYDPFTRKFTLGFPNGEVREGFANSLYKYYMEDLWAVRTRWATLSTTYAAKKYRLRNSLRLFAAGMPTYPTPSPIRTRTSSSISRSSTQR